MHGQCYRRGNGQPYTRKKYIKGKPQIKIAKFEGGQKGDYDYSVKLAINEKIQITHIAIESTRLAANKTLEKQREKVAISQNYEFIHMCYLERIK